MTFAERREYYVSTECHRNVYNEYAALRSFFMPRADVTVRAARETEAIK